MVAARCGDVKRVFIKSSPDCNDGTGLVSGSNARWVMTEGW